MPSLADRDEAATTLLRRIGELQAIFIHSCRHTCLQTCLYTQGIFELLDVEHHGLINRRNFQGQLDRADFGIGHDTLGLLVSPHIVSRNSEVYIDMGIAVQVRSTRIGA